MKNKSYIFCFVIFVICFISAYVIGYYVGFDKETKKTKYNEANVNVVKESTHVDESDSTDAGAKRKTSCYGDYDVKGYWIKTKNNYVVIYNTDGELVANTEISVNNFSEKDKQILNEGIYVENAESLFRYLESYTS